MLLALFHRPEWLLALPLVPLVFFALGAGDRRRFLLAGATLFALLAAADPRAGGAEGKGGRAGDDVVIALDVSRSMLARDAGMERLERAKSEIRALAARASGERLALLAFAGDATLLVPLTRDRVSLAALLDQADPSVAQRGGSDLGAALDVARNAFDDDADRTQTIVLLTDGEDLGAGALAAAGRAKHAGIVVHALGLGSRLGSKIVVDGEAYLRDPSGREVVSALDAEGLRRIADLTDGRFIEAGAMPEPLLRLLPAGGKGAAAPSLFRLPLLAAFVLFVIAFWRAAPSALLPLLLLLGACGGAQRGDLAAEMRATFLRGNAAYARSLAAAEAAAKTPEDLRAWMPAVAFAEDALAAWQTAAASRVDWPEARRNVERGLLWLRTLRESRGGRPKEVPREEPEANAEDEPQPPEPEERELELATEALSASRVLELLETLDAKNAEKRALRRRLRRVLTSRDGRDW